MMFSRYLIVLSLLVSGTSVARADWGCYDPKPGHPTPSERTAFLNQIEPSASAAENAHRVPASALAAMAIVESGYGWTRTALEARNPFGWKYTSSAAARGRSSYTLECQPPEDVNNKYVVFSDFGDAMDFVSGKLATLQYYRADAEAYQRARANGADVVEAVRAWVKGISDPYNWKPEEYTRTIIRLMNDPIEPGDTISPERNLYRLSEGVSYAAAGAGQTNTADTQSSAADADEQYAESVVTIWHGDCDSPISNYPRWSGFPVTLCTYSDVGATVRTYMLNADRVKVARWIATACRDTGTTEIRACIKYMANVTAVAASGNIYPVAGYIPEPEYGGKCFLFRDGVTVRSELNPSSWFAPANGSCGTVDETTAPLTRAFKFARIASTERDQYNAYQDSRHAEKENVEGLAWVDVVRELYQKAWNSERNELISARALRAKQDDCFAHPRSEACQ